ncbi:MAG: hypothetical protein QY325_02090 [Flavobacteriales bacterium]|nr:MAG: hypothetical protein QY325_02090 [Flavobacteriales bacterium]
MDRGDNYRSSPLFKKAEEIRKLATAIVESAPDKASGGNRERQGFEDHMLEESKKDIVANAYLIGAKIAGAHGMNLYDLQMENACLIRRACREMLAALRGLEIAGYHEDRYFDLLREAVEEFRPLFVEWVAAFKDSDRRYDDWGLFNLPGDVPEND